TSTNNYFREIGASVGTALFGSIFTSRLADKISEAMQDLPANAANAAAGAPSTDSLTPESVASLPGPVHDLVVNAYADALAPSYWPGSFRSSSSPMWPEWSLAARPSTERTWAVPHAGSPIPGSPVPQAERPRGTHGWPR